MAVVRTPAFIHWNFFLALEEDLLRLSRYVDLSGNDDTYSIEIARLLLSACAETDAVMKQLAARHGDAKKYEKFGQYFQPISTALPKFRDFEARIPRFNLQLRPWDSWVESKAPEWWSDHTKVKHGRHDHFSKATLKNCLNSLAGLFSATLHLYPADALNGRLDATQLFSPGPDHVYGVFVTGEGVRVRYANLAPNSSLKRTNQSLRD